MRKRFMSQAAIGAAALLAWSLMGTVPTSQASDGKTVKFIATDEPGSWFKCVSQYGCINAGSQSLAIIAPGDTVQIDNGQGTNNKGTDTTNADHTFTSLLWPTGAENMPFDQSSAFRGTRSVKLKTEGLYVFVCKLHPFMLAATIVDKNGLTDSVLELSNNITLISYNQAVSVPTGSDLATRLLRTFFLITNPANYQDHNSATNPSGKWTIAYPPGVPVRVMLPPPQGQTVGPIAVVDLKTVLEARYGNNLDLASLSVPTTPGVGEIWVDAEYEKTANKTKPGTAVAVDANTWKVAKRVSLPSINMNNPHNMWTDRNQLVIYQTQWFGDDLTVFNRMTGNMLRSIHVGSAPAHVMTRVDTDQVHVSLNGEDAVIELNSLLHGNSFSRRIPTQHAGENPAQPHAHWMSFDGKTMVTPNSNTNDSTRIDLPSGQIKAKTHTGTLPIASSIMPDASKYYVSNYLDSTITCISIKQPACNDGGNKVWKKDIDLLLSGFLSNTAKNLSNYNPITGTPNMSQSGALPIQTPVSPDGRVVITANTLSGTISIIDTKTDTLINILPCSAGCHGVNFGAKKGGGYYAYVSSKFSNDLIIVDYDQNNNGTIEQAEMDPKKAIAGRVLLVAEGDLNHDGKLSTFQDDSVATKDGYAGMGGQGVLPIPLVYNGWVQNLPDFWKRQLTSEQRHPFPSAE
jgi:DNA-binding beta-propeller fold protein YncE